MKRDGTGKKNTGKKKDINHRQVGHRCRQNNDGTTQQNGVTLTCNGH